MGNAFFTSGGVVQSKTSSFAFALLASTCLVWPLIATPARAQAQTTCSYIPDYDPISFPEIASAPPGGVVKKLNCGTVYKPVAADPVSARGSNGSTSFAGSGNDGGPGMTGLHIVVHNTATGQINLSNFTLPAALEGISIGGDGGDGGGVDTIGRGGSGGPGGNGGIVVVANAGTISTAYHNSPGIRGISQGGQGGAGGSGGFIFSRGGGGGLPGNSGDQVIGFNSGTVSTQYRRSNGMTLQSIGGVGGEGGKTSGLFLAIGGNGAAGGDGEAVTGTNQGVINVYGNDSRGINARSIGGGGGEGGEALASGAFLGVALGGYGGGGGTGGSVTVTNTGTIQSSHDRAVAIAAQSIGGGGGDGGSATAIAAGTGLTFTLAAGGSGGNGGNAGAVDLTHGSSAAIRTGNNFVNSTNIWVDGHVPGQFSTGILAQSIGGGGGHGAHAFAVSATAGELALAVATAFGGSGGAGGHGGAVTVDAEGSILTQGIHAAGIVAQSIGGGGGSGGSTVAASGSFGELSGNVDVSLAGGGGTGGSGSDVSVAANGSITTNGEVSAGVIAQSISGGGGNGGNALDSTTSVSKTSVNVGVALGGIGGNSETAGAVSVIMQSANGIRTYGQNSAGVIGQSIGGGGGNGGSIHSYAFSAQFGDGTAAQALLDIGGSGGAPGNGGAASHVMGPGSFIETWGSNSNGALLQSIGGGGGSGGQVFAVSTGISAQGDISPEAGTNPDDGKGTTVKAGVSLGGKGTRGGDGGDATLTFNNSTVTTYGLRSVGLTIQSIGGGGGNGGNVRSFSAVTTVPTSVGELKSRLVNNLSPFSSTNVKYPSNVNLTVDLGGKSGSGGNGGAVQALLAGGTISTSGNQSHGLVSQSVGGGGGTGGASVENGFAGVGTYTIDFTLGGSSGSGGTGGAVTLGNQPGSASGPTITTVGDQAYGVFAQSVGGGGGEGGATHSDFDKKLSLLANSTVTAGIGGRSGSGGAGGNVIVSSNIAATTQGSVRTRSWLSRSAAVAASGISPMAAAQLSSWAAKAAMATRAEMSRSAMSPQRQPAMPQRRCSRNLWAVAAAIRA